MPAMVIIGAGHAAGQAAASLRQVKYLGNIIKNETSAIGVVFACRKDDEGCKKGYGQGDILLL